MTNRGRSGFEADILKFVSVSVSIYCLTIVSIPISEGI